MNTLSYIYTYLVFCGKPWSAMRSVQAHISRARINGHLYSGRAAVTYSVALSSPQATTHKKKHTPLCIPAIYSRSGIW